MGQFLMRCVVLIVLLSGLSFGQEYHGPPPDEADVIYLLHAEKLIKTEAATAREESRKNDTAYVLPGAASPVKTPLAEPIFILKSENLQPQQIQLFSVDPVKGQREIVFPQRSGKKSPRPRYLTYKQVEGNVYWLEVNEILDNGQYCLRPKGSNDVFCFEIY
jgi:hypothetical protein